MADAARDSLSSPTIFPFPHRGPGADIVISFVNPRHETDMDVDCAVLGATARSAKAEIVHDTDLNAYNSFENPDRIIIKPHDVAVDAGRVRITLPALSVATVTVTAS